MTTHTLRLEKKESQVTLPTFESIQLHSDGRAMSDEYMQASHGLQVFKVSRRQNSVKCSGADSRVKARGSSSIVKPSATPWTGRSQSLQRWRSFAPWRHCLPEATSLDRTARQAKPVPWI